LHVVAFLLLPTGGQVKNKKPTAIRQWVLVEILVNGQNPAAALFSSSAFASSRFKLKFTRAT